MSGVINKIKEAVHSDNKAHHGAPEGTHGPHNTRAGNALDPRVDSDRDNRAATGRTVGHGEFGTHTSAGAPEGTYGPHGSRTANALDPRVDSDRDNRGTTGIGSTGRTAGHGEFGSSHMGTTGTSGFGSGAPEGTYGPHSSRTANTLDPRVDSDRDNRGTGAMGTSSFGAGSGTTHHGAGSGATGMTGTHGAPAGTYGPHSSRAANTLDPRVDSDRDGRGALGGHHSGPGPAPSTAGPHKSDMVNKMDPRVDSDLDGSKTIGGNKTYQ